MKYIPRFIEKIVEQKLFQGRIIIIYGPRRSGKTTLVKELLQKHIGEYFNCEQPHVQNAFIDSANAQDLRQFLGEGKFFVLDEAQSIHNIGRKLKLLVDTYPEIQILVTGSSSFELSSSIVEPLTGRKYEYKLYPLSVSEIVKFSGKHETIQLTDDFLRYGSYPGIFQKDYLDVEEDLFELSGSYLFKDILMYQEIKNPDVLRKLLQALALQIGNIVSYNELSNLVGIDKKTVIRYLDLLEKSFIIFRLNPFSRNLRKEIGKNRKIFFYDLGIRNALLEQFNSPSLRSDIGGLWENFCILERKKYLENQNERVNSYFWRTYDGKEIDLVEEKNGTFSIFEYKYGKKQIKFPADWFSEYETTLQETITPDNYLSHVT